MICIRATAQKRDDGDDGFRNRLAPSKTRNKLIFQDSFLRKFHEKSEKRTSLTTNQEVTIDLPLVPRIMAPTNYGNIKILGG